MNRGEKIRIFAANKFGNDKPLSMLSEAIDIPIQQLSTYVRGKTQPKLGFLAKLYDQGMDMNWFFSSTNDSTPSLILKEPTEKYVAKVNSIEDLESLIISTIEYYEQKKQSATDNSILAIINDLLQALIWLLNYCNSLSEINEELNTFITNQLNSKTLRDHLTLRNRITSMQNAVQQSLTSEPI